MTRRELYSRVPCDLDKTQRLQRFWDVVRLSVVHVTLIGLGRDDDEHAQVARDLEDAYRDLGWSHYDWRTHGGTWMHFIHRESDE